MIQITSIMITEAVVDMVTKGRVGRVFALLCVLVGYVLVVSGCGGSDSGYSGESFNGSSSYDFIQGVAGSSKSESVAEVNGYESGYVSDYDPGSGSGEVQESEQKGVINTEMLVYSCDIRVDTLNFEESLKGLDELVKGVGGFIENSSYSDGGSFGYYIYDDDEDELEYTATIRVPSSKYNDFLSGSEALGDVRRKQENVENISQEYGTASMQYQIYQTKYERYLKLLDQAYDTSEAIEIERELTDLEIKIADLRTRMNNMETDVAYSYVYITLSEVRHYQAKRDTFLQRMLDACQGSVRAFGEFCEGVLTFIVYAWWYILIIVLIIVVCKKLYKKHHKAGRKSKFKDKDFSGAPRSELGSSEGKGDVANDING